MPKRESVATALNESSQFKSGIRVWKDFNKLLYAQSTGQEGKVDGKKVLYVQRIHSIAQTNDLGSGAWFLERVVKMDAEEIKLNPL